MTITRKIQKNFIDNLQYLVTEYMKLSGYSVGISDLIADNVTNQKINDTISENKKEVNGLIQQYILMLLRIILTKAI